MSDNDSSTRETLREKASRLRKEAYARAKEQRRARAKSPEALAKKEALKAKAKEFRRAAYQKAKAHAKLKQAAENAKAEALKEEERGRRDAEKRAALAALLSKATDLAPVVSEDPLPPNEIKKVMPHLRIVKE